MFPTHWRSLVVNVLDCEFAGFFQKHTRQFVEAKIYLIGVVSTYDWGGNNGCGLIWDLITRHVGDGISKS